MMTALDTDVHFFKGDIMNCFDVLDLLEKTSSTNEKIRIIRENRTVSGIYGETLDSLLLDTFDYRRTYLIKNIPENINGIDHDGPQLTFRGLLEECEKTGRTQDTKDFVHQWLAEHTEQQRKWYRRVILRDLRCGVSSDTAIKAGINVPVFEVQLATDSNKCKKLQQIVEKGVWVSPKLDGYRCLAVGVDGEFTLYSRNGSVYQNFPNIKEALGTMFPVGYHVFDGEIMSGSFNEMQKSAFASKRGTTVGDVKYHIFDYINYFQWIAGRFLDGYAARYFKLLEVFASSVKVSELLLIVPHYLCGDLGTVRTLQAKFEGQGYEGAMCNPDIPYYMGRKSNSLLKFKSMLTWECEIIGFVEGKGRLEGTLGKVLVRQENEKNGEVGSGFDDAERHEIWSKQDSTLGRIIEVKFQEITEDGMMRFPIFLRYRADKETK